MRARYERDSDGRMVVQAKLYSPAEHPINKEYLSREVLQVIEHLQRRGFQACIVGGAVRDLLIGRHPKDFDVACNARPEQVRRIFNNARIIGKRFRLVHIIFPGNHVVEVATFRALNTSDHKPVYGSIDEDAKRRDFSLNGLYYDPHTGEIIDYVGGVNDIRRRIIRPIIPIAQIFEEDPVRMLRCLKFAAMFGFRIALPLLRQLKKDLPLLASSSHSRLSEELIKILQSGLSRVIFQQLIRYGACTLILPQLSLLARNQRQNRQFFSSLKKLDTLRSTQTLPLGLSLSYLLETFIAEEHLIGVEQSAQDLFLRLKGLLAPLAFANSELLRCIEQLCQRRGIALSLSQLQAQKWVLRRRNQYTRRPARTAKDEQGSPRRYSGAAQGGESGPPRRRKPPVQTEPMQVQSSHGQNSSKEKQSHKRPAPPQTEAHSEQLSPRPRRRRRRRPPQREQ